MKTIENKSFTLEPVNWRKSFYNKCRVEINEATNIATLISYTTEVASYNLDTKEMKVNGWYSNTTASHINSFLDYYGFDTTNKDGMDNWTSKNKYNI